MNKYIEEIMIISILNQKGGTGKTTLAVNIVREYTKRNIKTLLVDTDGQGSALRWHEESGGELIDLTCLPLTTLDKDIKKFKELYSRIIVDGVPNVASKITVSSIIAANIILIPVQPSPYDIWATEDLVRLIKERIEMTEGKLKAAFVVSRRIKGTKIGSEIVEQLTSFQFPIFLHGTYQRVEYAKAVQEGRTVCDMRSEAALEIIAIVNELEEFINGVN